MVQEIGGGGGKRCILCCHLTWDEPTALQAIVILKMYFLELKTAISPKATLPWGKSFESTQLVSNTCAIVAAQISPPLKRSRKTWRSIRKAKNSNRN